MPAVQCDDSQAPTSHAGNMSVNFCHRDIVPLVLSMQCPVKVTNVVDVMTFSDCVTKRPTCARWETNMGIAMAIPTTEHCYCLKHPLCILQCAV